MTLRWGHLGQALPQGYQSHLPYWNETRLLCEELGPMELLPLTHELPVLLLRCELEGMPIKRWERARMLLDTRLEQW